MTAADKGGARAPAAERFFGNLKLFEKSDPVAFLAEAGIEKILVPSCTDTVAGYNRVRIGAMARALESQCVVVQSPTVGNVDWCPAVDGNRGAAAIYAPPDGLWPESGVLAEGAMDAPGWVKATVDLDLVAESRRNGRVLPFARWGKPWGVRVVD